MLHFFAVISKNKYFSEKSKLVEKYFLGLNQKEIFIGNDEHFHANAWSHTTCEPLLITGFQRKKFTFIGSARLDNFDELREDVDGQQDMQPSELILELFEKYQEKCFSKKPNRRWYIIHDMVKSFPRTNMQRHPSAKKQSGTNGTNNKYINVFS